jgi:polysaccharide pyruvyl transferase
MSVTRAKLAVTGEVYQRVLRSPTPLSGHATPHPRRSGAARLPSRRLHLWRSSRVAVGRTRHARLRELQQFCTRANGVEGASLFRPNSTVRALRVFAARMLGKRAPKLWRYELRQSSEQHSPIAAPLEPSDALFRRISGASLIVTGRFHMVCLAMLARTPFIALPGNTHKTEGLLEDANLSRRFAHSLPDGGHFSGADWHNDELELVEAYLKRARSGALQMFAAIRQLAADR